MNETKDHRRDETSERTLHPIAIVESALKVGTCTGLSGLLLGGVVGTIRSPRPGIFAVAIGLNWFALGATFWASRSFILNFRPYQDTPFDTSTPKDRLYASAIAGGLTGVSVAALSRGRSHIIPGLIVFSTTAFIAQASFNSLDKSKELVIKRKSLWRQMIDMKWSPIKSLSDEEYSGILKEKLIRVEAEIALVEEDIAKLRDLPSEPRTR